MVARRFKAVMGAHACAWSFALACAPAAAVAPDFAPPELEPQKTFEAVARSRAPIELRGRDGAVLPLRSLEIRGEVEGPLAFTELHLEFENAEPGEREAVLEMVLPTRAKLARFAVEREGVWSDAGVVAREAVAPRDGLHAKTPAAVDYGDRGQLFRVIVPRLQGRQRTKMVVAYRELLAGAQAPYRVHLQGLPALESFRARVRGAVGADRQAAPKEGAVGADGVDLAEQNFSPVGDLVLRSPRQRTVAVQRDGLVAARIRPLSHDHHDALKSLTVLFDTSASRAPSFDRSLAQLRETLDELVRWTGPDTRIHLVAFDQSHETVYEGPVSGLEDAHFARLRGREALGASDLGAALRFVRRRPGHRYDRLLIVTDGVVTAGTRDLDRLSETIEQMGELGLRRVDVLEDGGLRDHATLRRLTRVLPRRGMVLDPSEGGRHLVRRLMRGVVTDVNIDIPDARWVYPGVVEGVQAGDELIVFAEFGAPLESPEISVRVSGEIAAEHVIRWQSTARPLLETAVAEAHVEDLSAALLDSRDQPTAVRRKVYRQIVDLSREHRLLNDFTRFAMSGPGPAPMGVDAVATTKARADSRGAELEAGAAGSPPAGREAATPLLVMGPRHAEARAPVPSVGEAMTGRRAPARFPRRYLTVDRFALVLSLEPRPATANAGIADAQGPSPDPAIDRQGAVVAARADSPAPAPRVEEQLARPAEVDFVGELRHDVQRQAQQSFGARASSEAMPTTSRRHWSTWASQSETATMAPPRRPEDAHEGNLLAVMNLLAWGEGAQAERFARAWRAEDPSDPLAVVALGEAYEAQGAAEAATRAYGSLIDLYPGRPDVRRFAGSRLEGLGDEADDLAIDTFRRALDQDPDSPASHRALGFALLRRGRFARAFEILEAGLERDYDAVRHGHAATGLADDLSLVAAAWARNEPARRNELEARLEARGLRMSVRPSLRVALTWETPNSDADLHVRDRSGHHAFHDSPRLPGGGRLLEDVTAGYGIERFVDETPTATEAYDLQVHYFSRGPLGYGMGAVEILRHDGAGGLEFELRPFVMSRDQAIIDLGALEGSAFRSPIPAGSTSGPQIPAGSQAPSHDDR